MLTVEGACSMPVNLAASTELKAAASAAEKPPPVKNAIGTREKLQCDRGLQGKMALAGDRVRDTKGFTIRRC